MFVLLRSNVCTNVCEEAKVVFAPAGMGKEIKLIPIRNFLSADFYFKLCLKIIKKSYFSLVPYYSCNIVPRLRRSPAVQRENSEETTSARRKIKMIKSTMML